MGKIGKPQKSRKHKKLKTVLEYDTDRQNRAKKLENLCPQDDDSQEMPRKVKSIMDWQEKHKPSEGNCQKKRKIDASQFQIERGMVRPLESPPVFKQGKKESSFAFMRRVDRETHEVVRTAQMEDKYKVKLTEDEHGKKVVEKRPQSVRKKEKDKERKKKKVQKARDRKLEKKPDFHHLKDEVQFGEVVMAPPTLTAKPRMSTEASTSQPGRKSLLLNQMLTGKTGSSGNAEKHKHISLATRPAGQSVKRKYLSPAQQRITDQQRQEAIDKYRELRDNKLKLTQR